MNQITELRKHFESTIAHLRQEKQQIFQDIDKAIEECKSDVPVPLEKSKFIARYLQIRSKY